MLAVLAAANAIAAQSTAPCAECVVIRATREQAQSIAALGANLRGQPIVVSTDSFASPVRDTLDALSRASASVGIELPLGALAATDAVPLARTAFVIVDARPVDVLDDAARFTVRTFVTALRAAAPGARVGIDASFSALEDDGMSSLRAYVDFVVADGGRAAAASQLAGVELWTSSATPVASIADATLAPRLPGSDRVVVSLAADRVGLAVRLAELRDIMPAGLTPLPDVAISCDVSCTADAYLHPQSLDAIAIVRADAPVSRVRIRPAASEVVVFGDVPRERRGGDVDFPAQAAPFVLRIRGWRGETDPAFASDVSVSATRTLTVDEVIARHQAARERQNRLVHSTIAAGSTVLTFQVPGFAAPFTVTADTRLFTHERESTVEQTNIRVNGLALARRAGDVPRLPLLEPERVSTPPLAIALTEAYRYDLRGRDSVDGRETFVVFFEPRESNRTLYAGRVWIDAATFGMTRIDAAQTGLRGPISSSRQIDAYVQVPIGSDTAWLPARSEIFQIYTGPAASTPIHRVVTIDRRTINPADFDAQLDAALRSDALMLRDTPNGYRFLLPNAPGESSEVRRLATTPVERITAAVVGGLFDPNISVPLLFAGVSYVDFNLLKTGAQLNVFFGGTYARFSLATRPWRGGWRLTADGAAVALSYNDRAFRDGVEQYAENIRQRPAQFSVALLGTIAPAVRVRAGYELGYTRYAAASTTAPAFVVPAGTPVHGLRLAIEAERGAWSAVGWSSVALRQTWTPWGLTPSPSQREQRRFERFGATLARSMVWSPTAVGRLEASAMSGARLDRFSRFAFGTIDNPLRGYPSVSIRYDTGLAIRSAATWTPGSRLRVDGFADAGVAREADAGSRVRAFPGVGAAIETPAPLGWLAAVEWGYGIKGVNTNGSVGTHVFRISGYKVF